MHNEQLAHLTRQLRRARRNLQGDAPYGPAWAASIEWVGDLEREIRDLGTDLGLLMSVAIAERTRIA